MFRESIMFLVKALNPVAFRRDREKQIQMLKQIIKYLRISLNPITFERDRVKQIQFRDKQISIKDKEIRVKDKQIQTKDSQIQAKEKTIQALRCKVKALNMDNTRLLAYAPKKDEFFETLSCLGDSRLERQIIYRRLLAVLPNDGYGYDYEFKDDRRHYPMAYALIASAEAYRYAITGDEEALTRAMRNADWLVTNSDLNNDGLPGWGLPFAWDAFQDGSLNPAHTQYAITTALCAKALLDTYDAIKYYESIDDNNNIDANAYKTRYLEIANESMYSFIRNNAYNTYADSRIALWYSLLPEDSYDTINIEAMCAGILQRLSCYPIDTSRAVLYRKFAKQIISYIMDYKQEYADGWVWNYLGCNIPPTYKHRLNDTVHAAYIVDGLMAYKLYGGKADYDIDDAKLLTGLSLFVVDDKVVHIPGRDIPARLWGIGYLLYVISKYFDATALADSVYVYAMTDLWSDDRFWFREEDCSDYVRDQTHMLVGLSYYAYKFQ